MNVFWRLIAVAVAALTLACSGEDTVPGSPAATATPAASPTPQIEALSEFCSMTSGYAIGYPTSWAVSQDVVFQPGVTFDAFNSPNLIDGASPNVTLLCRPLPPSGTTQDLVRQEMQGATITAERAATTAAGEGRLVFYSGTYTNGVRDHASVFLSKGACGWAITLTVPQGNRDAFMPVFLEMVKTFRTQ
ncbi:MAG: hypothetical protein GEU75_02495 [Dehalococcoidia bacterium]|nr:hypothetical protein [Dehalococcoidia bacterium]